MLCKVYVAFNGGCTVLYCNNMFRSENRRVVNSRGFVAGVLRYEVDGGFFDAGCMVWDEMGWYGMLRYEIGVSEERYDID